MYIMEIRWHVMRLGIACRRITLGRPSQMPLSGTTKKIEVLSCLQWLAYLRYGRTPKRALSIKSIRASIHPCSCAARRLLRCFELLLEANCVLYYVAQQLLLLAAIPGVSDYCAGTSDKVNIGIFPLSILN